MGADPDKHSPSQLYELFSNLLRLGAEERRTILAAVCREQPEMGSRLAVLLQQDELARDEQFLGGTPSASASADDTARPRQTPISDISDTTVACDGSLQPMQPSRAAAALADDLRCALPGQSLAARPTGVFGRVARWYTRDASAARVTAGVITVGSMIIDSAWCLIAALSSARGVAHGDHRGLVLVHSGALLIGLCPLFLWLGVRTIRGDLWALWISTILWCLSEALFVATLLGLDSSLIPLETMAVLRTSVETRLQVGSLLVLLHLPGVASHVAALLTHYVARPLASAPTGAKQP